MRAALWVIGLGFCLTVAIALFGNAIALFGNWRFRESLLLGAISWLPASKLKPATPPLLEGGLPAFEARIKRDFPPGSSASKLEETLRDQGFVPANEYQNAPVVRRATLRQTGGGLRGPYPAVAHVEWQEDDKGRIVWTKANLGYRGL